MHSVQRESTEKWGCGLFVFLKKRKKVAVSVLLSARNVFSNISAGSKHQVAVTSVTAI